LAWSANLNVDNPQRQLLIGFYDRFGGWDLKLIRPIEGLNCEVKIEKIARVFPFAGS
jgi:hypothetical protein